MKKFDSINVVPFIDIMLVLLAIVLTTSTFIAKGIIPVNLPKAQTKNIKKLKSINITIKDNGDIYFEKEKVDKSTLTKKMLNIPKNRAIALRCDKDAKIKLFVSIMEILNNLNFSNIAIVTKE